MNHLFVLIRRIRRYLVGSRCFFISLLLPHTFRVRFKVIVLQDVLDHFRW